MHGSNFVFHIYTSFSPLCIIRSVQKIEEDAYLMVNNEEIPLGNIINNPGRPENHTAGGLKLKIEFISAEPGTFQEDAGGGSIKIE